MYNDVREGIPSDRMNRDVMPHGIVDCFAGINQLGFVEAFQVEMCLGLHLPYCIYNYDKNVFYNVSLCLYKIQLLFNTVQSLLLIRPFDSIKIILIL
jgi:hypothetical protein